MSDEGPVLRLNPALDPRPFAEIFARDGVVQVPGIFEPEVADRIAGILERATPWELAYSDEKGEDVTLPRAEAERLGPAGVQARLKAVLERAGREFAFLYLCYPMIRAVFDGRDPDHPLHDLTDFINSREFLDFGQAVIGETGVTKADAQASFYRPGDFLNLHDDGSDDDRRRAAYTLGFSRRWRPDWGGQLLFHDDAGDIRRGLAPGFNVLTLFRVPCWHSVAPVASYATGPRLSIVGWLRNDPPAKG